MKDVVRAILRSLGIKLEDVTTRRLVMDYDTGEMLTTNDWIMTFVYKDFTIAIELRDLGSKESWVSLFKYFESTMIDSHRVELADKTAEELYKVIEDFINRKEVKTNECI